MKHFTLFLASAALVSSVSAQIVNGDFESWNTYTGNSGQYLDLGPNTDRSQNFLRTLNVIAEEPVTQVTAFRDQDPGDVHSGASAIRLENFILPLFGGVFVPGVILTGDVDLPNQTAYLGRPYTDRPDRFTGWYKYAPSNGDSAGFEVVLSRWDALNQVRQVVGSGRIAITAAANSYTQFNVDIVYTDPGTPDTIVLVCSPSAAYDFNNLFNCQGQVGSVLYVDDISLEYGGLNTENISKVDVKVFPTVASEIINIQSAELPANAFVKIHDMNGKVVAQQSLNSGNGMINVTSLAAGNYVVVIQDAFNLFYRTKIQKI